VSVDDKRGPVDFGVLWRLRRHVRRWRPNLVHSFGFDADVYSRLAGLGAGAPVLNSERTDDQQVSRVQHLGYRLTSLLCDGVVANTRAGAGYARRPASLGRRPDRRAVEHRRPACDRRTRGALAAAGARRSSRGRT
jgi:hypothetical protein